VTALSALNILVCGIGGQGVMTAAEVLAQTAIDHGFDAKKSEVAGMAQRGGVVTSHVRIGPRVLSPVIAPGTVDILAAFEIAEALRWCDQIRAGGRVVANSQQLVPPVVSGGLYTYPENAVGLLHTAGTTAGFEVRVVAAGDIAATLGDRKLINTIMLGALADSLPFPAEAMEAKIVERFQARKPALAALNRQAFAAGRQAARA
jgi:indolepyruvate ferredoxin oxidoreductase beta subunit